MRLEREADDLLVLTLDSPPLNLFDQRMIDDFRAAVDEVAAEPPRALLIRAEGRAFSGGVDVHVFDGLTPEQGARALGGAAGHDRPPGGAAGTDRLRRPRAHPHRRLRDRARLRHDPRRPRAKFGLVEKVVGITPSMGGTQRLAERAGSGRAREFVLTGEIFGAEEMERWGVVNRIHPAEEFDARARELAAELAAGPTKAHAMTKHVLRRFREGGIPAADDAIRRTPALFATEDLQNAVKTFLEHGGPGHATFSGR